MDTRTMDTPTPFPISKAALPALLAALLAALCAAAPSSAQPCDAASLYAPAGTVDLGADIFNTPVYVNPADMNGDGLIDLVVGDFNAGMVKVALATGPGVFGPATAYPAIAGEIGFTGAVAELNGDGAPDVVVYNFDVNTYAVLLNDGAGALGPPSLVTPTLGEAARFVVDDVDGDGVADLVFNSQVSPSIEVRLNNGDGTFGAALLSTSSVATSFIAADDMNGDGTLDILTCDAFDDTVSVLLGNGDGTFQTPIATPVAFPGASGPTGIDSADFNGDGRVDVAISLNSGEAAVLLGLGDGTLADATPYDLGGGIGQEVVAIDLDGDGDDDLMVRTPTNLTVRLNNGVGAFGPLAFIGFPDSRAFAFVDIDADTDPDLLLADAPPPTIHIFANQCGPFAPRVVAQPESVLRSALDPAAVFAVGSSAATGFQWRLDGAPLSDDAVFSGAQTDTLTVAAGSRVEGLLDVELTGPGGSATSETAVLAVRNDCPADQNFDGLLSPADFNGWIVNYNAGCP